MAEDKKKDENKKGGKGSKLIIILLIAIIVLLLVAGGAFYFLVLSKQNKATNTSVNTNANTNMVQQTSNGMVTTVDVDEQTYSFEDITTNLADIDSQKFIKTDVALGYDPKTNKKLQAELEDKTAIKTPILRSEIVQVLRSKKFADFSDEKKVEQIKTEILNKVNMHLKNGRISNIYFSNLVIQ